MAFTLPQIHNPYISAIILMMGGVNMGFGLVYASFTLTAITNQFGLDTLGSTMFNVSGLLGAAAGAIIINMFVMKFGKRWCGLVSGIIGVVSWVGLGLSNSAVLAFIFRVLSGSTVGLCSTICPSFISEIAPPNHRYLFGFLNQVGISIGFLIVTVLGATLSWQNVAFICCFPTAIIALFIMMIPESPVALVRTSWGNICKYKKECFIAFLLMFFLQYSGINAVMSNMQIILANANLTVSGSLVGILANVAQLVSTVASAFIVDKLGNRLCWLISAAGQLIAFVLLCCHQKLELPSWVFIFSLFLEQLTYGIGTGPVPFAAAAELFRVELRSTAMAIATAENWILSASVCLIWPYLEQGLSLGFSFLFFAGIQCLSLIFGVVVFSPVNKSAEDGENDMEMDSSDEEMENMSRRLSHAQDVAEL